MNELGAWPAYAGSQGPCGRARARHPTGTQRGIALVLALWTGALLSVIATSFALGVRTESTIVANAGARLEAGALAESAVNRALIGLLDNDAASAWRADGRVYEVAFEGGLLRVSIRAETGKIDLNAAPRPLLEGLLAAAVQEAQSAGEGRGEGEIREGEIREGEIREGEGEIGTVGAGGGSLGAAAIQPAVLAAAILDWRDADTRARPLGAEDPDYRAAGLERGAGDRAFLSIDELELVLGMPRGLVERLRPVVTVHTRSPQIDPMTAPRLALLALPGLDPARVDAFLAERDQRFSETDQSAGAGPVRLPLHLLAGAERYLSRARARVYTILAEGRTDGGVAAFRQAVVRTSASASSRTPYLLLAWADEPIAVQAPRPPAP